MKYTFVTSALISVATLSLLALLGDPFDFFMLDMTMMLVVALFAAAFLTFGALVWLENADDERAQAHRAHVGHIAYLSGAAVLAVGIVVEALNHTLDPWLPAALGVMVLVKLGARLYYERKN